MKHLLALSAVTSLLVTMLSLSYAATSLNSSKKVKLGGQIFC